METRSSKRKRIAQILENEANAAIDRISDLPDDVLYQIMILVPIKCVAQMSVLSKRWKFLWSTFPDLDFTTLNNPFDISSKNLKFSNYGKQRNHPSDSTPMDFITQVLSVRDKHSDIRVLCFRGGLGFSRLNSLFRSAIKHNVRELDIEVTTSVTKDDYFSFPRCVIGSESLRVLKLKSGFRLPPSSIMKDGFQSLRTLSLSLVILYNQPYLSDLFSESSFPLLKNLHLDMCYGLKYLHVGCRSLEDLSLDKCFQLHGLDISCAKLEKMRVTSSFDAYSEKSWVRIIAPKLEHLFWQHNAISDTTVFEQSNFLREACISFFTMKGAIGTDKVQSVNSFLSGLSHAGSMVLETQTIEILSNNNFFILPFSNLKSLELNIGFSKSNVRGLACLFRSSLMLHTLIMKIIKDYKIGRKQWNSELLDMTSTEEEQYWESQIPSLKSFLEHLKVVKIHRFFECESEVTLVKFLLKHGKALEEMILCARKCNAGDTLRRQKIRSQMMGFSWASSNVKLAFH